MHTFLVRAISAASSSSGAQQGQPIFACVARGSMDAAEGVVLGELSRAGWKVLEVVDPVAVRREFPALKRHPAIAKIMTAAQQRGVAFLVL